MPCSTVCLLPEEIAAELFVTFTKDIFYWHY